MMQAGNAEQAAARPKPWFTPFEEVGTVMGRNAALRA